MKTRRFSICSILVTVVAGISIMALSNPVLAVGPSDLERQTKVDDRLDPRTQEQRELSQQAMQAVLHGKAYGKTHEVARGQYVELARQG